MEEYKIGMKAFIEGDFRLSFTSLKEVQNILKNANQRLEDHYFWLTRK